MRHRKNCHAISAPARLVTINGARHELFHDRDIYRAQGMAAIEAFMPGQDGGFGLSETAA